MAWTTYLRAATAGASAGLRTLTAPAVTLAAAGNQWAWLVGAAAAGELVMDKLPATPSRLRPVGLGGRIVSGGFCGAALALRDEEAPWLRGALCGALAAVAAAFAGNRWRKAAADRGWPDLPAALAEDALALLSARAANA